MDFSRGDLVFKHYSWTALGDDNPKISGPPDSTLFNRNEGYEVVYMINKIMKKRFSTNVKDGQKTEKMFRDNLPGDVRSQENVMKWVSDNWAKY